jgi:predicted RNA-binding protein (virulence factor B family)
VYLDENSDRIVATAKYEKYLEKTPVGLAEGDPVELVVSDFTELGVKVIINNRFSGILYKNEIFRPLEIGDRTQGYIRKIREDQKIDVSLQKSGYDEVPDAAQQIMRELKANGGKLPLSDNSSPDLIYSVLGMSKKTFKKAIGQLYRQGTVQLLPDAVVLQKK